MRGALVSLLAAELLPILVAGAAFIAYQWRHERDAAIAHVEEHARRVQRAVDRELTVDIAVLRGLAASREIDHQDWRAFHDVAADAAEVRPGSWAILYDRSGQIVVHSAVPFGTPLPNFRALRADGPDVEWEGRRIPKAGENFLAPFETGKPYFAGLIFAPLLKRPAVSTRVPVLRNGVPVYSLALLYSSRFFEKLLQAETPPGEVTALYDQSGRFIARNRGSEVYVGRQGPPGLRIPSPTEGEVVGEAANIEGTRVVYARVRCAVAPDYVISTSVPKAAVLGPAWRAAWLWLSLLAVIGAVGASVAVRLWRRLGTPLAALAEQAQRLGDRHVDVPPADVAEVDAVRVALLRAADDVASRLHAEEALRDANEQLQEAHRRKDEFLGMLSHELRNPLAPIRNSLYLLDRVDPKGQQARRAKEVANRQVAHLTLLVDDLLDVTRIARGKIALRRAEVDVASLATRTAEDHRAVMEDRSLDLDVDVPDRPVLVEGDETRLAQVLGNLLHNAAKFTPAGGRVWLAVREQAGRAALHVRDTGPGIALDVLPTVFEPFTQAKQTLARSEGGLGLGLALVKGLVELHGGEVFVQSTSASGTEFVVTLPLRTQHARPGPHPAAPETRRGPRRRVLVIDDNRDAAESLAQIVEMFGHEVQVTFDALTGLGKALEVLPDVVLCDIGLPGTMDGYEFARQFRARSATRAVRLVAVSGYAQTDDVERAAEAGFDAHVAKPADPAQIARLLA